MKIWLKETRDSVVESFKNFRAFVTGRTITFQEYIRRECKEIFGDDNRWFSGENIQRSPSDIDCQENYLRFGGDKLFREKYRYLVERPWQKKVRERLSYLRQLIAAIIPQKNFRKWASN